MAAKSVVAKIIVAKSMMANGSYRTTARNRGYGI